MKKEILIKEYNNKINVLKDLLLDEVTSKHKMGLNYKGLSDAVNDGIRENMELKAELEKVKRCNETMDGILLEREEENKRLNDVLKDMREEIKDLRKACKLLKEDNKALIDKLKAVNNDYNNDHKVHNDYADGLLEEVEELKAENKRLNDVITLQNADIIQAERSN